MNELNKFPHNFESEQFLPLFTPQELQEITQNLADQISKDYAGQSIAFIASLKGSMIFLADLVRKLNGVKAYIDFIHLQSVGRTKESLGSFSILNDLSIDITNHHVLLVKEVIDVGRSVDFLKKRLQLENPKSLEIVTLFDKPQKRKVELTPKYIGKTLPDHFVVGHGLDLDQFGRNIQGLYHLKYPN